MEKRIGHSAVAVGTRSLVLIGGRNIVENRFVDAVLSVLTVDDDDHLDDHDDDDDHDVAATGSLSAQLRAVGSSSGDSEAMTALRRSGHCALRTCNGLLIFGGVLPSGRVTGSLSFVDLCSGFRTAGK